MATPRKPHPHEPRLYRAEDVARILACSRELVRLMRNDGRLKGRWLAPNLWRIEHRDLLRFIRSKPIRLATPARDMAPARAAYAAKLLTQAKAAESTPGEGTKRAA